ncbi:MAG: hypothetical protein HN849_24395 [Victivallales bacterium]|nr:hypothetical protein [Victivallales bacterium]
MRPSLQRVTLVHHTHMDIGYTDLASEVLDQHLSHLDRALALCRNNAGRPEEERFYWTIESAWLVRDFLACRPRPQRQELLAALRAGWLELQAFLTQPLTELGSADDLIDCLGYAAQLGRSEGFAVRCGMIDDIGGYAGRLPSIMAELGVPYLVAGVGAFQVHLPWANLPHLFYLEDKAGGRVLIWNLGIDRTLTPQDMASLAAVYGQAGLFLINPYAKALAGRESRGVELDLDDAPAVADARSQFTAFEERLVQEDYPYPELLLQYGGDNRGPDDGLVDLIRQLNAQPDLPAFSLATPTSFFQHMERTHGDAIPVVQGALTDPWNLRANPAPSGLKTFRNAQRTLRAAEAWHTLAAGEPPVLKTVGDCREQLQLYIDHTCGLSEWGWDKVFGKDGDCRAPEFDRYRRSWASKRQYADQALALAQRTARSTFHAAASAGANAPSVVVANECPFPMSGPVELYTGRGGPTLCGLQDEQGNDIPIQQTGNRRYVFVPPETPAFGMRWLHPQFGSAPPQPEGPGLRSDWLELGFDPDSGAIHSLRDRAPGREWLDPTSPGLGATIYETVGNVGFGPRQAGMAQDWERQPLPVHTERVHVAPLGPVFGELTVDERLDGPAGPIRIRRTVRLYRHRPQVDVTLRVDKPETAAKETLHIAFPLAGPGDFGFDQGAGWLDPARDLAPGAMQDLLYANSCIWAHADGGTAVLAVPDAPIVSLGRIRTGEWRDGQPFAADCNAIYAFIYHNLLNTDCPIWQDICDEFRFSLLFAADTLSPAQAIACSGSLRATLLETPALVPNREEELRIAPDTLHLHSIRPAPDGGILLVENTGATPIQGRIRLSRSVQAAWDESLAGNPLDELDVADNEIIVPLPPYALARLGFMWTA